MTRLPNPAQPVTTFSWQSLLAVTAAGLLLLLGSSPAAAQTYTVLHNFVGGAAGATPYAGVLIGRDGNLYGTTAAGGGGTCNSDDFGRGCGTVYVLNPNNQSFTALWQFSGGADGATPQAGLIIGPGGAIFGSTVGGGGISYCGQPGCGTVFRLTPPITPQRTIRENRWSEAIVYSFHGDDGNGPFGKLATDASGNIYGATGQGGAFTAGVVFRLNYANGLWTESKLHDFHGYSDGQYPEGGVTLDASGNVYGTTYDGLGYGDVYQLSADSHWTFNSLHIFGMESGTFPSSGVTLDAFGNIYGSTSSTYPTGGGTAFELTNGSWSFNLLSTFYGGAGPLLSNLVFDSAGNLYGTTYSDGSVENGSYGTVFKLAPSNGTWIYTLLHEFTGGSDGGYPVGDLAFDAAGNLYGTASQGGDLATCGGKGCGVVFRIRP